MKNRKLTCKEMQFMSLVGLLFLMIFNGLILKTDFSVFLRTAIELVVLIVIVLYFYCKKNTNAQ